MSLLKKHKAGLLVCLAVLAALVTGCASSSQELPVTDIWALFSSDHDIYLRVPVAANTESVSQVLEYVVPSLSPKDRDRLLSRLETVYLGVSPSQKKSDGSAYFELAAEGNFPSIAVSSVFSKKRGWQKVSYEVQDIECSYFVRTDDSVEASAVSSNLLCLSSSMLPMLDRYASANSGVTSGVPQNMYPDTGLEESILFYSKGSDMLPLPGGFSLPTVSSAAGSLTPLTDESGMRSFIFDGALTVSDARVVRSVAMLLNLVVSMLGGTVSSSENVITISGVMLPEETVFELLQGILPVIEM